MSIMRPDDKEYYDPTNKHPSSFTIHSHCISFMFYLYCINRIDSFTIAPPQWNQWMGIKSMKGNELLFRALFSNILSNSLPILLPNPF